jgi:glycine/D-amino acid oxidase-like deaminating enzyme
LDPGLALLTTVVSARPAEVVVIGGGVAGLSTARALVELGLTDVLVLERDAVGSGGTGKSSGIVRCHYGIPSLAAMAWRALPVLEDAAEILGAPSGYTRTGYLVGVGHQNLAALRANVDMQQALGIRVVLMDHEAAGALWPAARLDEFAEFAYEPCGGFGDGHQTALAFATAAKRGGARLRQHAPVVSVQVRAGRATGVVLADGSHVGAAHVVLAAGPWSTALARGVGIDLPVRAQRAQILLVAPGRPPGALPVFSDLVSLQYVRTDGDGQILLGDSDHSDPEWADPDGYRERVSDDELAAAVPKFAHRFPGFEGASLARSYAGCYDVTPDYNPIISASAVEGIWLCAGFSGHGYKISPSVGELMADLITSGASRHPDIDPHDFRWGRFAEEDPLLSPHPYVGAGQMR